MKKSGVQVTKSEEEKKREIRQHRLRRYFQHLNTRSINGCFGSSQISWYRGGQCYRWRGGNKGIPSHNNGGGKRGKYWEGSAHCGIGTSFEYLNAFWF